MVYNPITGKEELSKGAFNTGRSFIGSLTRLIDEYGPRGYTEVRPDIVSATESLIDEGKLGVLEDIKKIAKQTLSEVTTDVNPEEINAMKMAIAPQNYAKYTNSNKKEFKNS